MDDASVAVNKYRRTKARKFAKVAEIACCIGLKNGSKM